MRRVILFLSLIFILLIGSGGIYFYNKQLFKENNNLYQYFKEEKLVGVDGEINFSEIYSLKEESYLQLLEAFQYDSYDYDTYLKKVEKNRNDNAKLQKEIDDMVLKKDNLEKKKKNLDKEYKTLSTKYNKLKSTSSTNISNSYNFPLINQYPKYSTGCESVALTMLLRYYGVNVTPDDVIAKLKKGKVPYIESGVKYGGNPEIEFVGNPYTSASYGVYEKPMLAVANNFKSGAVAKSNFSFNEVVNLVRSGKPVMAWTSMNMAIPYISDSWVYKSTGETIKWKANEHAVVIIDVTSSSVIIADPIGGKIKSYSKSVFESRYNYYGKKVLYYL